MMLMMFITICLLLYSREYDTSWSPVQFTRFLLEEIETFPACANSFPSAEGAPERNEGGRGVCIDEAVYCWAQASSSPRHRAEHFQQQLRVYHRQQPRKEGNG